MSIEDRARGAAREVEDHYAAAERPPLPRPGAGRRRSRVVVLAVVLGLLALGAALLGEGGDDEPVRAGPSQGTVTTATTTTTTPTTTAPASEVPAGTPAAPIDDRLLPGGVVPPRSTSGDRVVLRVKDVSGERYLVNVPASTSGLEQVLATPTVYVGPARPSAIGDLPGLELGSELFAAPAAAVAPQETAPGWTAVPGPERELPGGAVLTRWEQVGPATPERFPLDVSTIERGGWTLLLEGPGQAEAPRVADALVWTTDEYGWHHLSSRDPSLTIGASPIEPVRLTFGPPGGSGLSLSVARGCEALETFDFAIGNLGAWSCLGQYRVHVEGDPAATAALLATVAVRPG